MKCECKFQFILNCCVGAKELVYILYYIVYSRHYYAGCNYFWGFCVSRTHRSQCPLWETPLSKSVWKKNQFVSSASIDNDNVPNSFLICTSHFPFSLPNFPQIENNFCFRQDRAVILVGWENNILFFLPTRLYTLLVYLYYYSWIYLHTWGTIPKRVDATL